MTAHIGRRAAEAFQCFTLEREELRRTSDVVLSTQIAVTSIAAPTGGEATRARWMADRFRALGFAPRFDDAGNVVARLAGASERSAVVVCAHLDTVLANDGCPPIRQAERVEAPGICDNGRGLAAMLALASALRRSHAPLRRPVEFVATTGEEGAGDLRGAKHHFAAETGPFVVIAIDGAGDERIVNGALGSRRFRMSFSGPGGHSWAAFGAPNPIHAAGHATASLAGLRVSAGSTLTVSRIGGGHSVNSIPEEAWLEIDARSTTAASLDGIERTIHDIGTAAVQRENSGRVRGFAPLTMMVTRIGNRPAGVTAENTALVQTALEATRLVGRAPTLAMASTDANAAMGIGLPAIAIGGGGRGGDTHTSREWYDDAGGSVGLERALVIVATMADLE